MSERGATSWNKDTAKVTLWIYCPRCGAAIDMHPDRVGFHRPDWHCALTRATVERLIDTARDSLPAARRIAPRPPSGNGGRA